MSDEATKILSEAIVKASENIRDGLKLFKSRYY